VEAEVAAERMRGVIAYIKDCGDDIADFTQEELERMAEYTVEELMEQDRLYAHSDEESDGFSQCSSSLEHRAVFEYDSGVATVAAEVACFTAA